MEKKSLKRFSRKANITLSIPEDILKQLRLDADSENVSVNQKVNKILIGWALLYRATGITRGIMIPMETWKNVIEVLDEDFLSREMDHGANTVSAILAQNNIPPTLENFIEFVFYGTAVYAGNCSHFHHYRDDSDNLHLVFEHSLGIKWSKALGKSICRFFNEYFEMRTELIPSEKNIKIMVYSNNMSHEYRRV